MGRYSEQSELLLDNPQTRPLTGNQELTVPVSYPAPHPWGSNMFVQIL